MAAQRKAQEILDTKQGGIDYAMAQTELAMTTARLMWLKKKKKS